MSGNSSLSPLILLDIPSPERDSEFLGVEGLSESEKESV